MLLQARPLRYAPSWPRARLRRGSVKRVGCGVLQGVQAVFPAIHGIWGFGVVSRTVWGWKSVQNGCKAYKILTLLTERHPHETRPQSLNPEA